jgi:hypothetical protein
MLISLNQWDDRPAPQVVGPEVSRSAWTCSVVFKSVSFYCQENSEYI